MKVGTVPYEFYTGQTLDYQHLNANFKKCADDINYVMGKRYCHTPLMIPFKNVTTAMGWSGTAALAPARFIIRFPGDGFVIESAFIYFETTSATDVTTKIYWEGGYVSRLINNTGSAGNSNTVLPVPLEGDSNNLSEYLSVTANTEDGIVSASSQKQLAVRDGESYCLLIEPGVNLTSTGNDCWIVLNIRSDRFGSISPISSLNYDKSLNPEKVSVKNISSDDDCTAASIVDRRDHLNVARDVALSAEGSPAPAGAAVDPFRMLKAECYVAWDIDNDSSDAEPGKKWRLPSVDTDNGIDRQIVESFHAVQQTSALTANASTQYAGVRTQVAGTTVLVRAQEPDDHVTYRYTTSGVVGGTSSLAVSGSGDDPSDNTDDKDVRIYKYSSGYTTATKAYVIVWYI